MRKIQLELKNSTCLPSKCECASYLDPLRPILVFVLLLAIEHFLLMQWAAGGDRRDLVLLLLLLLALSGAEQGERFERHLVLSCVEQKEMLA